jgi:hypothetical protein
MDTSLKDQSRLLFGAKPLPPKAPRARERLWTIRRTDGRILACELLDDGAAGGGVEVQLTQDGELVLGARCLTRAIATIQAARLQATQLAAGGVLIP